MIKNKVEVAVLSGWFSLRKLEKDREFRSEDLQEEKNEKQVWERQHNQHMIQNQQIQAQQSQAIQAFL